VQETEERMLQQVQLQMKAENLAAQRAVSQSLVLLSHATLLYKCGHVPSMYICEMHIVVLICLLVICNTAVAQI
jgi:hypothetical protein